ncbi:hypothetical protein LIER_04991 [Lithospermum erythrorhizon]|uniref:Uncharacterized protein n=1 Tax=Lithospermum erythrorhizon TaxID=34254 RepID=A0AAV3NYT0_LITER
MAYTPLYRGCTAKWTSLRSSNSKRNRSWSSLQEKVLHLKGSNQESSDPPRGFHFLGSMISVGRVQWQGPLKICGNFGYIYGYWEWVKVVLNRCGVMVTNASLTGMVQASLCVYDCSDKFLKAFCENWCPSTNILIIL